MTPGIRRFTLTLHVISSVGWLGAVLAYLGLVIAALLHPDAQTVRAVYLAIEVTGWYVIVPLAVASLSTGVLQSLGTPWGLFRHYWVVFKLFLTFVATIVLLLNMPTVSSLAEMSMVMERPVTDGLWGQLVHAGGGLLILLLATILGIYKPRGMTPYGQRMTRIERNAQRVRQQQ